MYHIVTGRNIPRCREVKPCAPSDARYLQRHGVADACNVDPVGWLCEHMIFDGMNLW